MSNVIDGIKLIKHNMGGVNEPDDLTYPFVLDANFRHPEFMVVASAFLYPGGEIIKVRGKTREALDELIERNGLLRHPRLRRLTIAGPDGETVLKG